MKHNRRQYSRKERIDRVTEDTPQNRLPTEGTSQKALRDILYKQGWLTAKTHGNMLQRGWPDLFISHPSLNLGPGGKFGGSGWIETKSLRKYHYVGKYQGVLFTKWERYGVGIWVLRGPDDYGLLFKEPNWRSFLPRTKGE